MVCSLNRSNRWNPAAGSETAIDEQGLETVPQGPFRDLGVEAFARLDQRSQHGDLTGFGGGSKAGDDFRDRLRDHRFAGRGGMLGPGLGKKEAEEVVDLGDRGHRRFAAAAGDPLLDGDGGRQTGDVIHVRLFHLLDELPGVGGHAVEETALSFREEDVEGQGRLAGTAQAGENHEFVPGISREMSLRLCSRAPVIVMQWVGSGRRAGVRLSLTRNSAPPRKAAPVWECFTAAICSGVPIATIWPPLVPPSGPRSMTQSADLMTSTLCSMTRTLSPLSTKRWNTFMSIAMSSKCRPVVGSSKIEEVRLCLRRVGLGPVFQEVADEFEPLAFPAGKGVERLAEPEIPEPDVLKHRQRTDDVASRLDLQLREERGGAVDGHFEDVVDRLLRQLDLQRVLGVARPFALRATHEDVAEELHFDLLVTVAPATFTTPRAGVEGESPE